MSDVGVVGAVEASAFGFRVSDVGEVGEVGDVGDVGDLGEQGKRGPTSTTYYMLHQERIKLHLTAS